MAPYFGKYRGKVVDNRDPLGLGRVRAVVSAIAESALDWAMPCVPYAGDMVGFFALPPQGANVWIEFEGGDPDYPIWTGCFWGQEEVPVSQAVPTTKFFRTETVALEIDDQSASLSLEVLTKSGPVKFEQGADGIGLTIGGVSLRLSAEGIVLATPPSSLSVNSEGVALKNGSTSAAITPAAISLTNGVTAIELGPASIDITNGAASVALSPATVSLNHGALEVT